MELDSATTGTMKTTTLRRLGQVRTLANLSASFCTLAGDIWARNALRRPAPTSLLCIWFLVKVAIVVVVFAFISCRIARPALDDGVVWYSLLSKNIDKITACLNKHELHTPPAGWIPIRCVPMRVHRLTKSIFKWRCRQQTGRRNSQQKSCELLWH